MLIDALHDQKTGAFSTISPLQWTAMRGHEDFISPDLICCTHCHPDHFSPSMTAQAKRIWPKTALFLPEPYLPDQYLISGREMILNAQGLSLRFFRLPHEGKEYAGVSHYGILAASGGFQILAAGDCEIASPVLAEYLAGESVDLAILDFPWLTLNRGRRFIREHIRPRHLLICHLPFSQDDTMGYQAAARACVPRLEIPDIRLLCEPFQKEEYEI